MARQSGSGVDDSPLPWQYRVAVSQGGSCEIPRQNASAEEVAGILASPGTVAVVGLSPDPGRESHRVARYLTDEAGYRLVPVNPAAPEIMGEKSYPSLAEVPEPVGTVLIFRKPEAVPEIVEAAITRGAKTVWMQSGIVNNAAADRARAAGLQVVMSKCMMAEHRAARSRQSGTGQS